MGGSRSSRWPLRDRRHRGPLELDLPERKLLLTPEGKVDKVLVPPRLDAHKLIEEFMVLANVAAAEMLESRAAELTQAIRDTTGASARMNERASGSARGDNGGPMGGRRAGLPVAGGGKRAQRRQHAGAAGVPPAASWAAPPRLGEKIANFLQQCITTFPRLCLPAANEANEAGITKMSPPGTGISLMRMFHVAESHSSSFPMRFAQKAI
jgi:hypothetical protein